MIVYRHATFATPLRTEPARQPGRFHDEDEAEPTQYLCLHPLGPLAELMRGHSLRRPDQIRHVQARTWALRLTRDVELPEIGRKLNAGDACAVVESVKTASDIYSPVSGEVVEVNKAVVDNPALVNSEPFAGGWFYKIKLSDAAEMAALLGPRDYLSQIGG